MKENFTERELLELCFFIAFTNGMQAANILLGTDIEPGREIPTG
jgi:alkylhydroperoxidase family enzyme